MRRLQVLFWEVGEPGASPGTSPSWPPGGVLVLLLACFCGSPAWSCPVTKVAAAAECQAHRQAGCEVVPGGCDWIRGEGPRSKGCPGSPSRRLPCSTVKLLHDSAPLDSADRV